MSWFLRPNRLPKVRRLLPLALALALGRAHPSAHDVAPDPTVDIFLRAAGDRLAVQVRLPTVAITDANLPTTPDGRFVRGEIGPALDLVARGMARDLEMRQGADLLATPTVATTLSPDESLVTIDLQYQIRPDQADFSARIHAFRVGGQIIRTRAHYAVNDRTTRTFAIAADSPRVMFDPSRGEAFQHFVQQGTTALLTGGDFLLFVLCVIATPRRKASLLSACVAVLAGQSTAIVLASTGLLPAAPTVLTGVQAAAASAIVVAALQALVSRHSRWLSPLAFGFGLMNGITIGTRLLEESAFAGGHMVIAVLAALLIVILGQTWMIALLSSAAGLVRRRGFVAELAVLAVAVFAGHQGLHRVADRGQALADSGVISLDRFFLTVTLLWAGLILLAGILNVVFSRFSADQVSPLAENS